MLATGPIEVAVLLGHAHVPMALDCLGSLRRYCAEPLRFRIHDDGTLEEEDRRRLGQCLHEVGFVSREEADDRLAGTLAGHSAARRFRATNPLGLKLLDVPLLAAGGEVH